MLLDALYGRLRRAISHDILGNHADAIAGFSAADELDGSS